MSYVVPGFAKKLNPDYEAGLLSVVGRHYQTQPVRIFIACPRPVAGYASTEDECSDRIGESDDEPYLADFNAVMDSRH